MYEQDDKNGFMFYLLALSLNKLLLIYYKKNIRLT